MKYALIFLIITFCSPALAGEAVNSKSSMNGWQYAIGGVLGTYPGFGIGHAVQGRWQERGWMMTAGELGSIVVLGIGMAECGFSFVPSDNNPSTREHRECGLGAAGLIALIGFKVWEIVDVWGEPLWDSRIAIVPPTLDSPAQLALQIEFR